MSGFPYQKVLIIGATSGIGAAMAKRFIQNNIKVIVTGRRKENLDAFVAQHGSTNDASALVFDITHHDRIPSFVAAVTAAHPDLDCIFLNSGMQRAFNFADPASVDLDLLETELDTNYTSFVRLTVAFIPFLQQQSRGPTAFMYTTSGLALTPMLRAPNYCATKAALHQLILVLRDQLAAPEAPARPINVIEVFPPAVQTELHDERHQPDIKNGRSFGIPLAEFVDDTWAQLSQGRDQIPVGFVKENFEQDGKDGWEVVRQKRYREMVERVKSMGI